MTRSLPTFFKSLLTTLLFWLVLSNQAAFAQLLDVDEAFQLNTPEVVDGKIQIQWNIAEDYKLYKDKFKVIASNVQLGELEFSKSEKVNDAIFGESEIFHRQAIIKASYSGEASRTELTIQYQGCADKLGVCYPPQKRQFFIDLPETVAAAEPKPTASFSSIGALDSFLRSDNSEPELLPADQAFAFSHAIENQQLTLSWQIAKGYHLYRDKIKTVISGDAELGQLNLPTAIEINDPVFGKTNVYKTDFNATLAVAKLNGPATITVEYQGCSAESGVCYPPEKKQITINPGEVNPSATASAPAPVTNNANVTLSETDQITETLKNSNIWIVLATFFVFGLLLSLTPCIFPMIPILSSIIAGQGSNITTKRAFTMSLVYVLAMSVTYTVAGVLAGLFGENLQAAFQNPWIIGSFSLVFIVLAMSMFGFYELQLPSSLQTKLSNLSNKQEGGKLTGVAIMGFLSALIVGPCVAPPLAGALIYIGQTGDALLGGAALFVMSLGMGLPLLLLGTSAGKLLPRAGMWMETIKAIFGVMLIGVAIWMASRIVPTEVSMTAWALLFIITAVYMGAFVNSAELSGWRKLFKGFGLALFAYGLAIMIGLLAGSKDMLQPLKVFQGGSSSASVQTEKLAYQIVKSSDELDAILAKGQPVMLDFYADWCVSCKEMEQFTFSDATVQQALKGVTILKADVTANDDVDKALMKRFSIIGPPAILFFDTQGQEQAAYRVVGFKNAADFSAIVKKALP